MRSKMVHSNQWRSHWGGKGGRVPPLTAKYLPKIGKKRGWEKSGKKENSGRKFKNREGSFTLPLLTDRAGYDTDSNTKKPKSRVLQSQVCYLNTVLLKHTSHSSALNAFACLYLTIFFFSTTNLLKKTQCPGYAQIIRYLPFCVDVFIDISLSTNFANVVLKIYLVISWGQGGRYFYYSFLFLFFFRLSEAYLRNDHYRKGKRLKNHFIWNDNICHLRPVLTLKLRELTPVTFELLPWHIKSMFTFLERKWVTVSNFTKNAGYFFGEKISFLGSKNKGKLKRKWS